MSHPWSLWRAYGEQGGQSQQGFTMVELLIVVAIIGILAAIALPQFSAYRMKAFNAAATSDLAIVKLKIEAYFAENQVYPH